MPAFDVLNAADTLRGADAPTISLDGRALARAVLFQTDRSSEYGLVGRVWANGQVREGVRPPWL
jgi:hypothetical protein